MRTLVPHIGCLRNFDLPIDREYYLPIENGVSCTGLLQIHFLFIISAASLTGVLQSFSILRKRD